ncbi:MAG TPA: hypothetical protein ENN56_00440 [Firmicutes bacterium]|nr:hypothetical protein [Bacillota bacterium]
MITRTKRAAVFVVLALATTMWMSGCSDNPTPLQSTSSSVKLLSVSSRAKPLASDQLLTTASLLVDPEVGGMLAVGEPDVYGETKLTIPAGAVSEPTVISMEISYDGPIVVELQPHGIQFDKTVELAISYKPADLTGIDLDEINVYYFNENLAVPTWERVPNSTSVPGEFEVVAPLSHFSRYAPGSEG